MTFVNHVYLACFGVEIQEKVVVEKGKLIDSGVDGQRFQFKLFRADGLSSGSSGTSAKSSEIAPLSCDL